MRAVLGGSGAISATLAQVSEVSLGEMIPAMVEVPWMLAAAVDEALMAAATAGAFGPVMHHSDTDAVLLALSYDGAVGYDYPVGYDQGAVMIGAGTTCAATILEVTMASSASAGPGMTSAPAPTAAAALTYDATAGYDYPASYDADAYVPAAASMSAV